MSAVTSMFIKIIIYDMNEYYENNVIVITVI